MDWQESASRGDEKSVKVAERIEHGAERKRNKRGILDKSILYILAFIFGSVIGSFLNVCIYRLPKGESIISPRSHCPHCNTPILWYDNIPFISYLNLRGRCRYCKERISFRYFLVELIAAGCFLGFVVHFGLTATVFIHLLLVCGLIISSFVDLKHQIIPDEITYTGIAVGLFFSLIYPPLQGVSSPVISIFRSILGIVVGGGSLYLLGLIGNFLFKKESMGGGDVKLLGMVGAFVGWKPTLLAFFIAPLFGSTVGIILKVRKKIDIIPYGPFLSLGAIVSILWGEKILNWLLGMGY